MGVVILWLREKDLPRVLVEALARLNFVEADWAELLGAHPEMKFLCVVVMFPQFRLLAGGLQLSCLLT